MVVAVVVAVVAVVTVGVVDPTRLLGTQHTSLETESHVAALLSCT